MRVFKSKVIFKKVVSRGWCHGKERRLPILYISARGPLKVKGCASMETFSRSSKINTWAPTKKIKL